MQVTLRQLQIFRAVALTGSTTAAALRMPLSQSATSTALKELESSLQSRLFDRVGKRLVLNDNGRALLPMALGVLDGAQHVESAFSSNSGVDHVDLRLAASTTIGNYILPKVLATYCQAVPRARLDVHIGNTQAVVDTVNDFSADLGLIEGPCRARDIIIRPWFEEALVIVAAASHPLAKAAVKRKLGLAQLREAPWLLREPGSGTREAVELALLPHLSHLQPSMTLGSSESIKNTLAEGLGVSCLPLSVVKTLVAARRLTVLSTRLPPLTRMFALIHHRNKTLSVALTSFIRECETWASDGID